MSIANLKRRVRRLDWAAPGRAFWVLFCSEDEDGVFTDDGQSFPSIPLAREALGLAESEKIVVVKFVSPKEGA